MTINFNDSTNKVSYAFGAKGQKKHPSLNGQNNTDNSSVQNDSYQNSPRKPRKGLWALGVSAASLALGFIVVGTGNSQNLSKRLQKAFVGMRSNIDKVKNKYLHKVLTHIASGLDRTARVITNSSPIKDYLLIIAMEKTEPTRRLLGKISAMFTKENKTSVLKSIDKSKRSYTDLITILESAVAKSQKDPSIVKNQEKLQEMIALLEQSRKMPDILLPHGFDETFAEMQKDMGFLRSEITFKKLVSKEALQGFVPQDILMQRRIRYAKKLCDAKNKVSCEFKDIGECAGEKTLDTNVLIYSIKDVAAQKRLKEGFLRFSSLLSTYATDCSKKEGRDQALRNIQGSIADFRREVETLSSSDIKEKLMLQTEEYSNLFQPYELGTVQKLRVLAGEAWGDGSNLDKEIKQAGVKCSKDMNLTLTRLTNMFDKQRDIVLGSGPGDLLGLTIPAVIFGMELKKDKTNDERVGTSLELGIPLLGGSLVYLKTLALQFNGFKALATSFASGYVMNLIGRKVYQKYMDFKHPKPEEKAASKTAAV